MDEIKYGYTSAIYCEVAKYTCLMPVEYIKTSKGYKKSQMACSHVESGECDQGMSCKHYMEAQDVMAEFLLKDKKM